MSMKRTWPISRSISFLTSVDTVNYLATCPVQWATNGSIVLFLDIESSKCEERCGLPDANRLARAVTCDPTVFCATDL